MNQFRKQVLTSIRRAVEAVEKDLATRELTWQERKGHASDRLLTRDGFGIPLNYRDISAAEHWDESQGKRWQRAIKKLETVGLVERVVMPGCERPTRIRLTKEGESK